MVWHIFATVNTYIIWKIKIQIAFTNPGKSQIVTVSEQYPKLVGVITVESSTCDHWSDIQKPINQCLGGGKGAREFIDFHYWSKLGQRGT